VYHLAASTKGEHPPVASATEYLRFIVTLTAVVDPFLAVPFFLVLTHARTPEASRKLARSITLTVFVVLACATFFGETMLEYIGASLPSFRVGGGLVLLLMALAMLNAEAGSVRQNIAEANELQAGEVSGVVPLAIPLLAGPGAISTCILAAERGGPVHKVVVVACIALVALLSWLILSKAHFIEQRLSRTSLNVATRILGLLLAAMAVQTMAEGLVYLFPGLAG
jgi:multiple antibiotic resistance protein